MSDNRPRRRGEPAPERPAGAPSPERPQEYLADIGFDDLALSPEIRRAIAERGYTHPTPVQAKAFGPVMEGKDLIVRSQDRHREDRRLRPAAAGEDRPRRTRRCARWSSAPPASWRSRWPPRSRDLGKYKGVQVAAIYGGASMKAAGGRARGAARRSSSARPGRVYDHIRRKNLKLDGCRHVVLDEADEMLNQGFYEEVTRILDQLPKDRQVLLFSRHRARRTSSTSSPVHHRRRRRCCSPATSSPSSTSTTSATTSPTRTRSRATSSTCWRWRSRTTPSSSATPATTPRWSPRCSTATASTPSCSTATCRRRSASG